MLTVVKKKKKDKTVSKQIKRITFCIYLEKNGLMETKSKENGMVATSQLYFKTHQIFITEFPHQQSLFTTICLHNFKVYEHILLY